MTIYVLTQDPGNQDPEPIVGVYLVEDEDGNILLQVSLGDDAATVAVLCRGGELSLVNRPTPLPGVRSFEIVEGKSYRVRLVSDRVRLVSDPEA